MDAKFAGLYESCRDYTLTSKERMYALYKAVEYVVSGNLEGAVVECGVWRGGSSMLAAMTLMQLGATDRDLYLYDTYAGMSEPTALDVDWQRKSPLEEWRRLRTATHNEMTYCPIEQVQESLYRTGYPRDRLHFVKGRVEDTIPATIPDSIAVLRLDTDWYESTHHELTQLFPRLVKGGVLIIDDYGHWRGAREATDNYFSEHRTSLLLNRVDYTGRIGVRT